MGRKKTDDLPQHLRERHDFVTLGSSAPANAQCPEAATLYDSLGIDNSFSMEDFKKNFRIEIKEMSAESMVFDMIGVDAPIANAFRRILLAEIPTMAFEKIYIADNTSIIPDEILAHRIGLVPVNADPDDFQFVGEDGEATFDNTLVFRMDVQCKLNKGVAESASDDEKYIHGSVLSGDLVWVPQGDQFERFQSKPIALVNDKILLAKLRPGQRIELEAHCQKGISKTHAKWSPVATASYRLQPVVQLRTQVTGDDAEKLKSLCPMNVFDIEDLGKGQKRVVPSRPRDCTMCRECVRTPDWESRVLLAKQRDHFIFSIESTGAIHPRVLVQKAIVELMNKCTVMQKALDQATTAE